MLPTIRGLLGNAGRAWAVSRRNPLAAGGETLAAALAAAGLEVELHVHPTDAGLFPSGSWGHMVIPELLLLRPVTRETPCIAMDDLSSPARTSLVTHAMTARGYASICPSPFLRGMLRLAMRSNVSDICKEGCDAASLDIYDGAPAPSGLFQPPGWKQSLSRALLPRLHGELTSVAASLLGSLAQGHRDAQPAQGGAWLDTAKDELKETPSTLRLFTYFERPSSELSSERWVATGPHQDVSWLTLVVQPGKDSLWLKRNVDEDWKQTGSWKEVVLTVFPGARLHHASHGFFPLPCHAVSSKVSQLRTSWVLLAPNHHCLVYALPRGCVDYRSQGDNFLKHAALPPSCREPGSRAQDRLHILGRITRYSKRGEINGRLQSLR
eukprot:TRINITY_DN51656_c0_g1_i1.p1 TRINITY_DN51656_c0_g1~~TRINITY_DN51656_c0_g1_i1.p1  ORF type:complete len:414 (+),score=47.48 TRINITY_DN51656_c0_g1_i1:102-1244(+)